MGQQVSGAAAASIKKKFIGLFNDEPIEGQDVEWVFPTPSVVASSDISFLRQAGLSQRKAEYIKGLAEKFASGELSAKMLIDAPYEEMMEKLIAVRGLGQWSVEMFACFTLKRMDVFSTGDLGVQYVIWFLDLCTVANLVAGEEWLHSRAKMSVNSKIKAESGNTCPKKICLKWLLRLLPTGKVVYPELWA